MGFVLGTPAVILRTWPYGESDKLVALFTEAFGKLRGIAKGAKRSRKRFANSLEPFSVVNLRFQERPQGGLALLLSADLVFGFRKLDSSLEKITLASYLVEIVDGLLGERDANPPVFHHLKYGLHLVESGVRAPLQFLTSFELKLLRFAGYQPALDGCKRCALPRNNNTNMTWQFSPGAGGLFCRNCALPGGENLRIGGAALSVLDSFQQDARENTVSEAAEYPVSRTVLMEIRCVMQRFLQFHMEREIRSAAFLSRFIEI